MIMTRTGAPGACARSQDLSDVLKPSCSVSGSQTEVRLELGGFPDRGKGGSTGAPTIGGLPLTSTLLGRGGVKH